MDIIRSWIEVCLGWLFPVPCELEILTSLSPDDFSKRARRAIDSPHPSIHCLFSYSDPLVRRAIWELKYRGNGKIARMMAPILRDEIVEILADSALFSNFSRPLLVPVPLSDERLWERGWNQTEILARELARLDKNNFFVLETKILKKKIHTRPQTALKKSERLKNLKDCFEVEAGAREKIKNRNIILLDDVTTTGSTLLEAARALKAGGARSVIAFAIAH